jgi:L-threonylcarbamoyladenylate synthase
VAQTALIPADEPGAIERALRVLQDGGLVAFPTDTVYGVGAAAFNAQAVGRIYEAKGRSEEKAIPVLLAGLGDLERVAAEVSPDLRRLAAQFWPGPLTLVVAKHADLPIEVSPGPTVGLRVPDHPVALELLAAVGPMAVTSANRSGGPNPATAAQVLSALCGKIELILDGGQTPGGRPSTVVDCTKDPPILLRPGPIPLDAVLDCLAKH